MLLNKIKKHEISKSFTALFTLQFVSMIAPLLVYPYLARVLGIEGFGSIVMALSLCAIGVLITDFGFNLSATYKISKERDNINYVNELIGAIYFIKIFLIVLFFIFLFIFSFFIDSGLGSYSLLISIGLNVLIQSFIPTWFFQGIERMKVITIYMVAGKLSFLLLVFMFVNKEEDIELVVLLNALSSFFSAAIALKGIYSMGYKIKIPNLISVIEEFKFSSQFFLSRAAVAIYTSASAFIVGAFSGLSQAALYGACEKLYQASKSIASPLSQAMYPYMAKNKDSKLLLKVVFFVALPLSLGCLVFYFWSQEILALIFGEEFRIAAPLLQVFLVITLINFISVNFGYPAFAGLDKVHVANYTVVLGAITQLLCLLILYMLDDFSAMNIVTSILITESIVAISRCCLFLYYKKNIKSVAL